MDDKKRGLYEKFTVSRTDGTSEPGQKHECCEYFVLDIKHDPFAIRALRAYWSACLEEYPLLAADIKKRYLDAADKVNVEKWAQEMEEKIGKPFHDELFAEDGMLINGWRNVIFYRHGKRAGTAFLCGRKPHAGEFRWGVWEGDKWEYLGWKSTEAEARQAAELKLIARDEN
jgi:hypothetical protein